MSHMSGPDDGERCFAVYDDLICTREVGHTVAVGHYDAGAVSGWVEVPSDVRPGVDKCRHGVLMVYDPEYTHPPMAAPSFWCECCLQLTYYIASSHWTHDPTTGETHGGSTVVHTELCGKCGGGSWTTEF